MARRILVLAAATLCFGCASKGSSMSSAPTDRLDNLEQDLPTSPEDVAVLRRLRRTPVPDALRHPNLLNPPPFLPEPPPRPTFEGAEEFVLE